MALSSRVNTLHLVFDATKPTLLDHSVSRSLGSEVLSGCSSWQKEYHLSLQSYGDRSLTRKIVPKFSTSSVLQPFQGKSISEHDNTRLINHNWLKNYQPRKSNSALVSFLVDYSVFMSDCWRFQSTTKDRVEKGLSHAIPVVLNVGNLASPMAQTVGQVAYPVARTVNNIAMPVANTVNGVAQPVVRTMSQFAQPVAHTVGQITYPVAQSIIQFKFWPLDILVEKFNKENNDGSISEIEERVEETLGVEEVENSGEVDAKTGTDEEIISETVDEIDPSVVWGQRAKDVEAEKERGPMSSPGFSFSAAGLLFPYHLGVAQFLIENGLIKGNTPLSGASAGAIVCAVIASGIGMKEALIATKQLAKDCRENGTVYRLGAVLRKFLEDFLPENAHITSSGRIRVAVTQLFRTPRSLLVDQFDSREDLINALITSSYVPGFLAPTPVTRFRNVLCVDGGLSSFIPPTAADKTVRVCAFPASSLGFTGEEISPDLNPQNRASMRQLFSWALEPADDFILDIMFEDGYNDAKTWFLNNQSKEKDEEEEKEKEQGEKARPVLDSSSPPGNREHGVSFFVSVLSFLVPTPENTPYSKLVFRRSIVCSDQSPIFPKRLVFTIGEDNDSRGLSFSAFSFLRVSHNNILRIVFVFLFLVVVTAYVSTSMDMHAEALRHKSAATLNENMYSRRLLRDWTDSV